LLQEKEDEAKTSQATLETLHLDMEKLASAREDLSVQLRNKDTELAEAKSETSRLNGVLERYRTEHI
jgi:chromosome segregation ATPase